MPSQAWAQENDVAAFLDAVESSPAQGLASSTQQSLSPSLEALRSPEAKSFLAATAYIAQRVMLGIKTEANWLEGPSAYFCEGHDQTLCLERSAAFVPSLNLIQSATNSKANTRLNKLRWKLTPESLSALKRASDDERTLKIVELLESFWALAWVDLESPLEEPIEALFSAQVGLDKRNIYSAYASILPLLERHALEAQSTVRIKKLRQVRQSIDRYLPEAKCDIVCYYDTYSNGMQQIERNELWLNLEEMLLPQGFTPRLHIQKAIVEASAGEADLSLQENKLRCHAQAAYDGGQNALLAPQHVEDKLEALRLSLVSRDSDAIDEALIEVVGLFESFKNHHGHLGPQNGHWQGAPIEAWLCALQCLSMTCIEQHRMVAALWIDRIIQDIFSGSDFYARLSNWTQCEGKISKNFRRDYDEINSLRGSEIHWIQKNFTPKSKKKLDRAFSAWIKRVPKDTVLYRRLIASFTALSQGDLSAASRFGQKITDDRPSRYNPQIHAYDFVLNASQNRVPDAATLDALTSVLDSKAINHAYLSFAISAPYLSRQNRIQVVDIVRSKAASRAPNAAAIFFRAYQTELLQPFKPKERAGLLRWLDQQFQHSDSPIQSQIRRERWLSELVAAKDWKGLEKLAQVIQSDTKATPFYRQLFAEIGHIAQSQSQARIVDMSPSQSEWRSKAFDNCQADALKSSQASDKNSRLIYLESLPNCLNDVEMSRRIHL